MLLEKLIITQVVNKSFESPLLSSQQPVTGPYSEPDESNLYTMTKPTFLLVERIFAMINPEFHELNIIYLFLR
jgi:hypothetical protein